MGVWHHPMCLLPPHTKCVVIKPGVCVCERGRVAEEPKLPEHLVSASQLIKAMPSISLESFLATKSLQSHLQEEKGAEQEP